MDIVGHLERFERDGELAGYIGELQLQDMWSGDVCLKPVGAKRSERSPDWEVLARSAGRGKWMNVGSAWNKKMEAPNDGEYFSMTVKFLSLRHPGFYLNAFPDDADQQPDGASEPVHFSIKFGGEVQSQRRRAPQVDTLADDGIPI
jgi:uncharacterized protein (DUF736 family)